MKNQPKTLPYSMYLRWLANSLLLGCLLCSCSSPIFPDTAESLGKLQLGTQKSPGTYFIIPNAGCDGCITTAEDFVIRSAAKYPNTVFIFTAISSVKTLKGKIPKNILALDNVIVDHKNYFYFPEDKNKIYPMAIYMKGTGIEKVAYQNPENDAIGQLVNYLEH